MVRYFTPYEFQGFYNKLHTDLLPMLDELRHKWGKPVYVSTASGAVGRHSGKSNQSRHNIDYWGSVMAVDIFPDGIGYNKEKALEFYLLAKEVGFKGIGLYPHFKPSMGFHLDVRKKYVDWVDTAVYPKHNYVYYYVEVFLGKRC